MAFTFAAFCYIVALILTAFLIFFAVYHVIAFDELKSDYKNPIDQCNSLNPINCTFPCFAISISQSVFTGYNVNITRISPKKYLFCDKLVLPEYIIHIFYTSLFLFAFEFLTVLINFPLIVYHINRYRLRPVMSGPGLYDPTTIMNADQLSRAVKEGWVKLGFYILTFFYYLYGMIHSLIMAA